MPKVLSLLLCLALQASAQIPEESRQAVLVICPQWDSVQATLTRWERSEKGVWRPVGSPMPVVVGRSGLAWGLGIHPAEANVPPRIKREGDGCAPAGIFELKRMFGSRQKMPQGSLPYQEMKRDTAGVDDPDSRYYNQIVQPGPGIVKDWKSAERMLIPDYKIGVVVEHNTVKPVKGAGSCIFMHIWERSNVGTAGCTATSLPHMRALAEWLRKDARPVLIQLPAIEYERYREAWKLPDRETAP